jgi:carboxypeptidase Taq
MQDKLKKLKARLARVADLAMAANVLEWDMETHMPEGGSDTRSDQIGALRGLAHQYFTDEEVGALFDDLKPLAEELGYDSDDASIIRVGMIEYEKQVRVPGDLVEEMTKLQAQAQVIWRRARVENNFKAFQPYLEKTIELQKRYAACFQSQGNPYDVLLDRYEPDMSFDQIHAIFSSLKPQVVELVRGIAAHQSRVDDSVMRQHYPQDQQLEFGKGVAAELGYDFNRGRLDLSAHPFSIHFSRDDSRITTRVNENFLPTCLMGVIHETGHSMYEQGTSPSLYRIGLGRDNVMGSGTSYSVHESQSRFYENVIGRSRPFWKHFFPKAQAAFPSQLGNVKPEDFYRALNKSEAGLIRVEADEVTYGLHIMLRFEIENDLINNRIQARDLPEIWNTKMREMLGLTPPNDADGVLQDIHWSAGYFGYFPDYLLGSIFSVQLWDALQKDIPDVESQIEHGKFEAVLDWQRTRIHQHGKKFSLPELAQRATGRDLTWEPYVQYLTGKYGEVYGL